MFREMRRRRQQLSPEECKRILAEGTSGVLAVRGDEGYPYAVSLSYVYEEGRLFFHGAAAGHRRDAVLRDPKASFCVIGGDRVVPEEYTTYFRSVIVFGKIRILEEEAEKRSAIEKLAEKYSPRQEDGRQREIDRGFSALCMMELTVEHMTGKQAVELMREKL